MGKHKVELRHSNMAGSMFRHFRRRKLATFGTFVALTLLISTAYIHEDITIPTKLNEHLTNIYDKTEAYLTAQNAVDRFYTEFFESIIAHSPSELSDPLEMNCELEVIGVNADDQFYSEQRLSECLKLKPEIVQDLKESHSAMFAALPEEFPDGFYSGDGIVMVGGGRFSVLAALSIKTLRYQGTTLPVEVFIPEGEDENQAVCDMFTTMNAKCISLKDIIDQPTIDKLDVTGYQLKSLAIMASSFENILMLDADNNAVVKINDIFETAPFNETGLVTWPDYWKRATSPHFYDIADIRLGKRVRNSIDTISPVSKYVKGSENLKTDVPMHDRLGSIPDGSTESGQLLINKYKHAKTIMLSFYYNYNGPQYYYPLLGQGTSGEGDKDTFLAAAVVLGKPFYQVKKGPGTEGYHRADGFHGTCMLQADHVKDYALFTQIPQNSEGMGFEKINKHMNEGITFLHAHHPKLDPYALYKEDALLENETKPYRLYAKMTKYGIDFDFELLQFILMNELFCEKRTEFRYIEERRIYGEVKEGVCNFINEHYRFLLKDTADFGGV